MDETDNEFVIHQVIDAKPGYRAVFADNLSRTKIRVEPVVLWAVVTLGREFYVWPMVVNGMDVAPAVEDANFLGIGEPVDTDAELVESFKEEASEVLSKPMTQGGPFN